MKVELNIDNVSERHWIYRQFNLILYDEEVVQTRWVTETSGAHMAHKLLSRNRSVDVNVES